MPLTLVILYGLILVAMAVYPITSSMLLVLLVIDHNLGSVRKLCHLFSILALIAIQVPNLSSIWPYGSLFAFNLSIIVSGDRLNTIFVFSLLRTMLHVIKVVLFHRLAICEDKLHFDQISKTVIGFGLLATVRVLTDLWSHHAVVTE